MPEASHRPGMRSDAGSLELLRVRPPQSCLRASQVCGPEGRQPRCCSGKLERPTQAVGADAGS